ncbi:MAG: pyridoxamine 5'-phosphate oxidase family protein [Methanoregulaceae archaeon]
MVPCGKERIVENSMAELSGEMKEAFTKMKTFSIATASREGIPNVVPIAFVQVKNADTIWIADNFMKKTLANLKENPNISFFLWGPEIHGCTQVKGTVSLVTSDTEFEEMKKWVHAKTPTLPAKTLLIVKVTEIYSCTPGPGAGEKMG